MQCGLAHIMRLPHIIPPPRRVREFSSGKISYVVFDSWDIFGKAISVIIL